ncbi:MAG: hypothetical protein JWM89_908, partial [Acidimicrobiales bacterium]|nr:hypothetical protein [Acidimicrobiales bacterium]
MTTTAAPESDPVTASTGRPVIEIDH